MNDRGAARRVPVWLAPLLCAPIFLVGLGATGLADPDEGRNAEVGREMLAHRDFMTPRLNDAVYLDKPPVFFWAVAASLAVFGVNEVAARLPSALAALGGLLLVAWFARRHFGDRIARTAVVVLALSPLYMVFARLVIFDMLLVLCMSASILLFYEALEAEQPHRAAPLAAWAIAGVGTITKGPVALVLPLFVVLAWGFAGRRPGRLARLRPLTGLLVYAAVVVPWVAAIERLHPGFVAYAVLGENLARMTANPYDTARPPGFYFHVILPGLFPWILLVAAQELDIVRSKLFRRPPDPVAADHRPARFLALWLVVTFVFFSLVSSKRPSYILPCAVPTALLAARLIVRAGNGEPDRRRRAAGAFAAAAGALGLSIAALWAGHGGLARALQGRVDPESLGLAATPLFLTLAAAGLAGAAALLVALRRTTVAARFVLVSILPLVCLVPVARVALRHIEGTRSSRDVSRLLEARLGPRDRIYCFDEYWPGLNFYLQRPIHQVTLDGRVFTSNYIAAHVEALRPDGLRLLRPDELQAALADESSAAYVLAPRRKYGALQGVAGRPLQPIWEAGGYGLLVPRGQGG